MKKSNHSSPNNHLNHSLRLLRRICPAHLIEEIEGDLLQKFEHDLHPSDRLERSDGYWRRRAKRRLVWNAIRFVRPEIILRNKFSLPLIQFSMIRNNIKIAFRNFARQKSYTALNI